MIFQGPLSRFFYQTPDFEEPCRISRVLSRICMYLRGLDMFLYKSRRKVVSFWEFTEGMEVRDGTVAERNRRKRNCVAYSSLRCVRRYFLCTPLAVSRINWHLSISCSSIYKNFKYLVSLRDRIMKKLHCHLFLVTLNVILSPLTCSSVLNRILLFFLNNEK